jgi:hypothetical protein
MAAVGGEGARELNGEASAEFRSLYKDSKKKIPGSVSRIQRDAFDGMYVLNVLWHVALTTTTHVTVKLSQENDFHLRGTIIMARFYVSNEYHMFLTGDVAFHAYLSTTEKNPGRHQTLIFDHVVTNIGGNYNRHAGIFISPGHGVYTFAWTLYCDAGGYFSLELVVNSNPVGASYCNADGASYIRHTSDVIVVEINQGDIVYLRTRPSVAVAGSIHTDISARTTFSGWKLF